MTVSKIKRKIIRDVVIVNNKAQWAKRAKKTLVNPSKNPKVNCKKKVLNKIYYFFNVFVECNC